jgi:hypothetical protein
MFSNCLEGDIEQNINPSSTTMENNRGEEEKSEEGLSQENQIALLNKVIAQDQALLAIEREMNEGNSNSGSEGVKSELSRQEEKWTVELCNQLKKWKQECAQMGELHERSADKHKTLDRLFWIPIVVLPAISLGITSAWTDSCEESSNILKIVLTMLIISNSIVTGFYKLENPAIKREHHMQFEAHYKNLDDVIEMELSRHVNFRRPADVVLSEVRTEIKHLRLNEPPPSTKIFSCFRDYSKF